MSIRTDMLAKFKLLAQRPATDEEFSDTNIYLFLDQAQDEIANELAVHVPWVNYSAPELMVSGDSGITYSVTADVIGAMEIYPSSTSTIPLVGGAYWDDSADYTMENERTIRVIGNTARSFTAGPYARYNKRPTGIDASTDPSLKPVGIYNVIVYRALREFASIGGTRDPNYWASREQQALWGDPNNPGSVGIITALKQQYRVVGGGSDKWYARFL